MRRAVVALTAVMATALAGPVATASADSWNHTWSYLHWPSDPKYGECVYRDIWFARGTYRWRLFMAHWAHTDSPTVKVRRLRLNGGWYSWYDCVSAVMYSRHYLHRSGLRRFSGLATLESMQFPGHGDGQHHYGSTLRRIGP
jgi:hypothetical protein